MFSQLLNRLADKLPIRHDPTGKLKLVVAVAALAQIGVVCAWGLTGRLATHPLMLMAVLGACILVAATATVAVIGSIMRPVNLAIKFILDYDATGKIPESNPGDEELMNGLLRRVRNTVVRLDLAKKEVEEASKIDVLTGLLNRRYSEIRLQRDLDRASKCGAAYSVILIDMDDFKALNSRLNTTVGDGCLQHFAAIAGACIREGDWIGRWDGDKFMIGIWDAEPGVIESVISRIRSKFAASGTLREAGLRVTASYGYASVRLTETEHDLLLRVEAALKLAKLGGKNRAIGERIPAMLR